MKDAVKNCPLCHNPLYSELGKACKMCGMALEDGAKDFCSRLCRKNYFSVRQMAVAEKLYGVVIE
ncbi:MAG: hypothetical protein Q8N60_00580 [Candidatus Diapherotrites archaeon]|nr:hypothetical protein [Candidatus Diapherotrites archaeon]